MLKKTLSQIKIKNKKKAKLKIKKKYYNKKLIFFFFCGEKKMHPKKLVPKYYADANI